ncbi:MAG: ABC transporter substrate-binding protein [Rhodobacteraceae bacterium]|nr:ABC transporter substrate-binding protein [Paracoccaceae bacterium]
MYLDAEFHDHAPAARAIEVGVNTALIALKDDLPDGVTVRLVRKDHRGNVKRTTRHLREYLADPNALAVIGGLHSPPYLKHRDYVNENRILLLLPWSAAGPITRTDHSENWIFRLSVDDTKAGARIVSHALDVKSCENPALWLWDSGWGRSNEQTMTAALAERGISEPNVLYFSGSLDSEQAKVEALRLVGSGSDCALLVANAAEGSKLILALAKLHASTRVVSHWGITGGLFSELVSAEMREQVGLEVLQTCYSFRHQHPALELARQTYAMEFGASGQIQAPTGFFHGYDIAALLIAALSSASQDASITELRAHVRDRFENAHLSVDGLMRHYERPFSPYSEANPDAHEALGASDLCVTRYDEAGQLIPPR